MRHRVLIAFFPARADADRALDRLRDGGVPENAVRVLPKEVTHLDDLGVKLSTKTAEGAALGALGGGLFGATFGAITAGGALVLPGVGSVLAGPLVAACAVAGLAGAIGMLIGAVLGSFCPEYEATWLPDAVIRGGSLVAVRCLEDRVRHVEALLVDSGGVSVARSPALPSVTASVFALPAQPAAAAPPSARGGDLPR